jgi:hypothetical protein
MRVRLPDGNGQCRAVPTPEIRLRKNGSPQRRCGKPDTVQPMIAMAQP